MDEKVLEALLNATKGIAEINHYQERNVKELDIYSAAEDGRARNENCYFRSFLKRSRR